jgi:hypothetical protein
MLKRAFVIVLLAGILPNAPAFSVTKQEKMKTCEFGADDQKLTGAARKTFITKCMANEDAPAKKTSKKKTPT